MFRFLSILLDYFIYVWFCPLCPVCLGSLKFRHECHTCNFIFPILGKLCHRCGIPLTTNLNLCGRCETLIEPQIDQIRSLLWFNDESKTLIHLIKYQSRFEWLDIFLDCINDKGFPFNCGPVSLIPVPIFRRKFVSRGFNQSELIAERISRELNIPVELGLKKIKDTIPQSLLNREQRKYNLKGVYDWDSRLPVPKEAILIDDVLTTGETLNACAEVLKARGVSRVYAWTLFRTTESIK